MPPCGAGTGAQVPRPSLPPSLLGGILSSLGRSPRPCREKNGEPSPSFPPPTAALCAAVSHRQVSPAPRGGETEGTAAVPLGAATSAPEAPEGRAAPQLRCRPGGPRPRHRAAAQVGTAARGAGPGKGLREERRKGAVPGRVGVPGCAAPRPAPPGRAGPGWAGPSAGAGSESGCPPAGRSARPSGGGAAPQRCSDRRGKHGASRGDRREWGEVRWGRTGAPPGNSTAGVRSSAPGGAGERGRGGSAGAPSQPGRAGSDGSGAGEAPRAAIAPVRAAGDPRTVRLYFAVLRRLRSFSRRNCFGFIYLF